MVPRSACRGKPRCPVAERDQAWARRYIWAAMAETLDNDLHGNGATYIFEDDAHSEFDRRRIVKAAEQVLKTMRKRAEVPRG